MKKFAFILVYTLCTVTILGTLIGCDLLPWKSDAETTQSGLTLQELHMDLPADFERSSSESNAYCEVYRSDEYYVLVQRTDLSGITPNEGYSFPTLEEFMKSYMTFFVTTDEDSITFNREDGLLYLDADTNGNEKPDTLIVFFESEKAYWNVHIKPTKEDYETARAQCMEWAKTITITESTESN